MKRYDLIVIGSGAGMSVAADAASQGLRIAVIDRGPLGGTCLNRGCIPSKVMLYPADLIRAIQEASSLGVHATIEQVDFSLIMKRVWDTVLEDRHHMESGIQHSSEIEFYNTDGAFVSDHTLKVAGKKISALKIVIASGARPHIPPIDGLERIEYLTSATIFDLQSPPESLIIVGGGYIAVEFAHFFSAIGTEVTVLGRNVRLVPQEEPEISALLKERMSDYLRVYTGYEAIRAEARDGLKTITARSRDSMQERSFSAEAVLIAAGRRSNADILIPEKTGVKTDERGWIRVDPYLETTNEGIWAMGDAIGGHQFRHTANHHAALVWRNAFSEDRARVDDHAVPHAVFTHPQIASVGMTEEQAAVEHDILVGVKQYADTAKGYAMGEDDSFFKVVVERGTGRILGAHAIGPHAALLVQPLVYLMNAGDGDYYPLAVSQTIHPALGEVMTGAFGNLRVAGHHGHDHSHAHSHDHSHDHSQGHDHSHHHH